MFCLELCLSIVSVSHASRYYVLFKGEGIGMDYLIVVFHNSVCYVEVLVNVKKRIHRQTVKILLKVFLKKERMDVQARGRVGKR